MKKSLLMPIILCVLCAACGETTPTDDGSAPESRTPDQKQGKGDFIGGEEEDTKRFGNFEVNGELAQLSMDLLKRQGLSSSQEFETTGEAEGLRCTSFGEQDVSCALETTKVEVMGDRDNQTIWLEGSGAETLYTWMSQLAGEDESITESFLASGDAYTRGNVSCSWTSGAAPGCLVIVGDESQARTSKQELARTNEGFLVLDGGIASGLGVVLEEAGLITEMPKIDLKVGEAEGVRCSYDTEDVPMCEIDAERASLFMGNGVYIEGEVASGLYTLLDELEAKGSEKIERLLLASGEELSVAGFSCSWTSGSAPSCFAE